MTDDEILTLKELSPYYLKAFHWMMKSGLVKPLNASLISAQKWAEWHRKIIFMYWCLS